MYQGQHRFILIFISWADFIFKEKKKQDIQYKSQQDNIKAQICEKIPMNESEKLSQNNWKIEI